jgi:hypothetical protein
MGTFIRIAAHPTPAASWIPELTERDFQARLYRDIRTIVCNRLTRAAYKQVFADYFQSAASDGFADDEWRYQDGAFHFAFRDHGGSAMSAAASLHFVEVGAAIIHAELIHRQHPRWRVEPARSLVHALNHNDRPLVEIGKTLYVIGHFRGRLSLSTDEGLPQQDWGALREANQARFKAMWKSKTCGCQLCDYYRPRAAKAEAKKRVK